MSIDKKQLVKLISFVSTFDGGLYVKGNSNARFVMNMRKANLDYVEWVSSILNEVTSTKISDRVLQEDGYSRQPQVCLQSKNHPFLTSIRNRLYLNNKKILDPHMLKLLDAEALAIIYMADGSYKLDKGLYPTVHLNTKGFSIIENMALSKTIYEKLDIRSNVNRQNQFSYLRVKSSDVPLFMETVKSYIKPSFYYKLGRFAPENLGDDIVCSSQECEEINRNE